MLICVDNIKNPIWTFDRNGINFRFEIRIIFFFSLSKMINNNCDIFHWTPFNWKLQLNVFFFILLLSLFILSRSFNRSGSKISDQKNGVWSNWQVWVEDHFLVVLAKCVVFQWIYHREWMMPVFHFMAMMVNLNLDMADHNFIRIPIHHSFPVILSDRSHSMELVSIIIFICCAIQKKWNVSETNQNKKKNCFLKTGGPMDHPNSMPMVNDFGGMGNDSNFMNQNPSNQNSGNGVNGPGGNGQDHLINGQRTSSPSEFMGNNNFSEPQNMQSEGLVW